MSRLVRITCRSGEFAVCVLVGKLHVLFQTEQKVLSDLDAEFYWSEGTSVFMECTHHQQSSCTRVNEAWQWQKVFWSSTSENLLSLCNNQNARSWLYNFRDSMVETQPQRSGSANHFFSIFQGHCPVLIQGQDKPKSSYLQSLMVNLSNCIFWQSDWRNASGRGLSQQDYHGWRQNVLRRPWSRVLHSLLVFYCNQKSTFSFSGVLTMRVDNRQILLHSGAT